MSPEEEEARDRLLFHLENQIGFWFGLVVSDDAGPRARLCEAAQAWCKEHDKPFSLHEPEPDRLVQVAVSLANGESPGVHWIRADGVKGILDAWNAGAARMLMAMNERREAYRTRLDGGIVVEGRLSLKRILREMAPDLFSIRAFIAEPGEDPAASDFPEWSPLHPLASVVSPEWDRASASAMDLTESEVVLGWWLARVHLESAGLLEKEDIDGAKESARQALDLVARLPVQNDENADLKSKIEALRAFVGEPRKKRRPTKH